MLNHVTDVRVRRVSFVDRAATRDPENPTEPRRALLFKSQDVARVELAKRRIGREGATPAPEPGSPHRDVDAADFRLSSALEEIAAGERRMLADRNHCSPAQLAKHKEVRRELENELFHLHHPEQAAAREQKKRVEEEADATRLGLTSALSKAEALQKFDPNMSSAEAFRQAMRDPAVQDEYYREIRTRPASAPRHLTKAESDCESVEHAAEYLVKAQGLGAAEAYARALRESGLYSRQSA
jgi:hypothetical protein